MPAVLNTNAASLYASKSLQSAQSKMAQSVERLSSGLRINRAKDDAAGFGISNTLLAQVNSANQGVRNLNDGVSMIQTTEGAVSTAQEVAQRILALATQGANGTLGTNERTAIQSEMKQLLTTIDSIGARTKFSGNSLLSYDPGSTGADSTKYTNGTAVASSRFQLQSSNVVTDNVGLSSAGFNNIGGFTGSTTLAGSGTDLTITLSAATTWTTAPSSIVGSTVYKWTADGTSTNDGAYVALGVVSSVSGSVVTLASRTAGAATWATSDQIVFNGLLTTELSATNGDFSLSRAVGHANLVNSDQATAVGGFQMVQRAADGYVKALSTQRSLLGAYQNQVEYTVSNVSELSSNLEAARSNVIDSDYASETATLTKGQILQQAATAMLAQANQMPNVILSLLK
jgi:flagellin